MTSAAASTSTITVDQQGPVAIVRIDRVSKRNALNTSTIRSLEDFFNHPPADVKAAVLTGRGGHFCAGLDLADLTETDVVQGLHNSREWHRVMQGIESGPLPVVSALRGAVIGGGMELASATHIRVVEESAFLALPESQHAIYLGGGGSVRLPRLLGIPLMMDMMLTGRSLTGAEGFAAGFAQRLAPDGGSLELAVELAHAAAQVAPTTTFAVLQALPRSARAHADDGFFIESLMASVAQSTPEAKERMRAFLDTKARKHGAAVRDQS